MPQSLVIFEIHWVNNTFIREPHEICKLNYNSLKNIYKMIRTQID